MNLCEFMQCVSEMRDMFADYQEIVTLINQYEHWGMTDEECIAKLNEIVSRHNYQIFRG